MFFYTFFVWIVQSGSFASIIILPLYFKWYYLFIGVASFILYPLILEVLYNLHSKLITNINDEVQKIKIQHKKKIPVIYDDNYNIRACGIEKAHPFDSTKYAKIFDCLQLSEDKNIKSFALSRQLMVELGMSRIYLLKLCYSIYVSRYVEQPLCCLPECFVRSVLLDSMILQASGTVIAASVAVEKKWAINLGGGFHHASCDDGQGFCVYPDISFAANFLQKFHGINNIMIVDLDAHQGNGYARDFLDNDKIIIVDAYNHGIYPNDNYARQAIDLDINVTYYDKDDDYMKKLNEIEQQIVKSKPEFVIYNAGSDILRNDPLGALDITIECMKQRDLRMFQICNQQPKPIPILMLLSGGYQRNTAQFIAQSIEDIINSRIK
ncbi:hypothetical protein pb186bvf_018242 [Paramecium bursaria]